jgi:hypothetical protein
MTDAKHDALHVFTLQESQLVRYEWFTRDGEERFRH